MDFLTSTFVRSGFSLAALFALATVTGCKPDLDQRAAFVRGARVLAVRAEPAEAEPRDSVKYSVLAVDENGAIDASNLGWAYCTARKPLAELGPVNPICLSPELDLQIPLGNGAEVQGTLPNDACRNFGPEIPQAKPGEPFGRPVDPDPTGGYFQPLRLLLPSAQGLIAALGTSRLSCGVAGAGSEDVIAFRQRYHVNENPVVAGLTLDGVDVALDAPTAVRAGARVHMRVTWPACPESDVCGDGICGPDETSATCTQDCAQVKGCFGAERFVYFDADARRLVVRRESMRVSWFSGGGAFDVDRTGREESDSASDSENDLTVPELNGKVDNWVVLRDGRGGVAFRSFTLEVR